MSKKHSKIEVRQDGLIKVNGIPVCRRVQCGGEILLEVVPRSKNSHKGRECDHVTVTLKEFVRVVEGKEKGLD